MAGRILPLAVIFLVLTSCGEIKSPTAPLICPSPAPYFTYEPAIPGRYVVDLKEGVPVREEAERLARRHNFELTAVFEHVLGGFSAQMSVRSREAVRCENSVESIHQAAKELP